jgi:stearoyl-CoA desaturase (delta-9 desaturase)
MTLLDWLAHGMLAANWWQLLATGLVATHITIASVTIYLHRCQAHRALRLHPLPSHFFRFWLWLTTGMVTREWVAVHRCHHTHCETELDPHSPRVQGINTVLWRGAELYRDATSEPALMDRYGAGTPDDWVERHVYSRYVWQGPGLLLLIDFTLFGALGITLWAVQMMWIPFFAAGVINGLGHYAGYRNHDCKEAATNIIPLGLLVGGEELHNNHHTYPTSAKLSVRWFEFDIGWGYIRILQWLRLASVRQAPNPLTTQPRQTEPTLETLRQVLANQPMLIQQFLQHMMAIYAVERRQLLAHLPRGTLAHAGRLLRRDPSRLTSIESSRLMEVLARSHALQQMHKARLELELIWNASAATPQQLLGMLQSWCHRAQQEGPQPLRRFAHQLSRYG